MNSRPETGDESTPAEAAFEAETVSDAGFAVADASLFEAHDLARAALLEITPAHTIGAPAGHALEPGGAVSLYFETTLEGYPGWRWTVTLARVEGAEPTVLEAELMPGEGALLAPDWLPWAERLAEYQALQAAAAAERAEAEAEEDLDDDLDGDDELDELDDLDDLDAADFDQDGSPILHAGDVDGVDIDSLDEEADDDGSEGVELDDDGADDDELDDEELDDDELDDDEDEDLADEDEDEDRDDDDDEDEDLADEDESDDRD